MLERSQVVLKILCGAMGLLVVYRLVLVIVHLNPLYHVSIPQLPTLTEAVATNSAPAPSGLASQKQTSPNLTAASVSNAPFGRGNLSAHSQAPPSLGSNNADMAKARQVGSAGAIPSGTNLADKASRPAENTNSVAQNSVPVPNAGPKPRPLDLARRGPMGPMGPMGGGGGPELPANIQARIDRVVESEILAPVMRPLPMALLGIAGKDVFLRAPNGQTGLIKEGEELGGVKLVRIGINRVLVEEQGERKELMIFAGLGGETLLSNQKDSPK